MTAKTLCRTVLILAAVSITAYAGDGVTEINQARALAGGVTPGDAEGFPVTLSQPGSYRLTGNLTLSGANTHGIEITTDHVTIDLNGFAITGPTTCEWTGGPNTTTCAPLGQGSAIRGNTGTGFAPENITIRNGTVQGAGAFGISFVSGRVERVRAVSNGVGGIEFPIGFGPSGDLGGGVVVDSWALRNGGLGISVGVEGFVGGSVASFNGGSGIQCSGSCVVQDNVANWNGGDGLSVSGGAIQGNAASNNTGFGLNLGGGAGYSQNVVSANTGGTVDAGTDAGGNVCNSSTTCP